MNKILNLDTAKKATMNNKEFLKSILKDFCQNISLKLESMEKAVSKSDKASIKNMAHSLKGSSSSLGAEAISEISLKIEMMGNNEDIDQIDSLVKQLEQEFFRFKDQMESIEWNDI